MRWGRWLVVLGWLCLAGCEADESSFGDLGAQVDCDNLGALPSASQSMNGYFTFGTEKRFPLSVEADAEQRTFHGQARIEDAQQSFAGPCDGSWDDAGVLTGSCALQGSFLLNVTLEGRLGERGGCGTWDNDVGQSGDWVVAP